MRQRNTLAYEHYLRCRATGQFPIDAIVARNAAIIRSIEEEFERSRIDEIHALLSTLVGEQMP
ncbi:MAG: hypothetical protein RIC55_21380 [Pirellulaceae bacterium]